MTTRGVRLLAANAVWLLLGGFATHAFAQSSAFCAELPNHSQAYCQIEAGPGKYVDYTVNGQARATASGNGVMSLNMAIGGAPCNLYYGVNHPVDNETFLSGPNFRCSRRLFEGQNTEVTLIAPNERATAVRTYGTVSFTEGNMSDLPRGARATCVSDTSSTAHCDLVTTTEIAYADFTVAGSASAQGNGQPGGSMQLNMSTPAGPCNSGFGQSSSVDNNTVLSGSRFRCVIRVERGTQTTVQLIAPNVSATAVNTIASVPLIKLHPINEVVLRTPNANAPSLGSVSDASGRYVVFQSQATNVGSDGNGNISDIFRKDTETGTVVRLSSNNNGTPLAAEAIEPSVSADGRLVVFVAADAGITNVQNEPVAKTLARGKASANTYSVLLRNLLTNTTQRMSIPAQVGGAGTAPQISPEGNALVYTAPDPNTPGQSAIIQVPLPAGPNGSRIIGSPRCLSCKMINANGSDRSENAIGSSRRATLSDDGRFVVWETAAKNLLADVPSPCPNTSTEIVLRDLITGGLQRMSSPPTPGQCGPGNSGARNPKVDWKGRRIVFESDQPLKPGGGDTNGVSDIYLRDLDRQSLARVSETESGGNAPVGSSEPSISGDGEIVAYVSEAANLDTAAAKASYDPKINLHVRAVGFGGSGPTMRLSKTRAGAESNNESHRPALNFNGTQLAFDSVADNLTPEEQLNHPQNVYQRENPLNAGMIFGAGFD